MKKLFVFVLFACQIGLAQKGHFEIGLSAGLNSSKVSNPDDELNQKADPNKGCNVGFSADYYLSDHWSLKGKLIYDQKGLDGSYVIRALDQASGFNDRHFNSNYELEYLTLPITVNWHFGKKVNFSIGVGGYVGYLLSSNEKEHQTFLGGRFHFSTTDYGAAGTIAIKYPLMTSLKIGLEYERQQGFADLYPKRYTNSPKHQNSRNSFSLGLYYSL